MNVPFISIIVPTFDRHEALTVCIRAIRQLEYPHDRYELIVVDDGNSVPVNIPADEGFGDMAIKLLRQLNSGPAAARNLGAAHARGEILAFTDDDCAPAPQWLRSLAQSVTDAPAALVGGQVVNGLAHNPYSSASQIILCEAYAFFHSRNSDLRFFATNNMSVAADQFQGSGGFDSAFRFSEDRDFCDRWIRQGKPLLFAPGAIVRHHHDLTLSTFVRQHFNYGRGAFQLARRRARCGESFFRPSILFHLSVFAKVLFTQTYEKRALTTGLLVLWQLANLAGFIWQAVHLRSWSIIPWLRRSS